MPRCLYCLGWYFSETDDLQGSSCECGENVCAEDKIAECEAEPTDVDNESLLPREQ